MKSFNPITVVPFHSDEHTLYISKKLSSKWKLTLNGNITVCIGKQFMHVEVHVENINDNEIHIPNHILEEFYLPLQSYSFNCQFIYSIQTLYLAPIVGLLTEVNEDDLDNPHFRSVHSFSEELEHVTKQLGGLFYVFPLQNMMVDHVIGYFYNNNNWCKSKLPMPDVIYNRIHSRILEFSELFQQFRIQIQSDQIPMFNDRFLSKWEVYDVLMTEEHLQPHIPITKLYTEKNIDDMLVDCLTLFIKPIHGSQGRNIIRITQIDNHYHLHFSSNKEKQNSLILDNTKDLYEALSPYMKKSAYLIQQGIPFIQHQNRYIDFRVLCHKNSQDLWIITSTVARLSAEKQFVSNIARGGETMKPINALSLYFDKTIAQQQLIFMKELALEFAHIISQNSEGLTGELGIDMGIDIDGNPWIIEANSKPSKNFEEQEIKIRPSAKAIISYCYKLALERNVYKEERH